MTIEINKLDKLLAKYQNIKFDTIFGLTEMKINYEAYAKDLPNRKMSFGLHTIDVALCGGMRPNELITVIASTNVGKSTLALNIARNVAGVTKKLVIYFSLELAEVDIYEMLLKMEYGLDTLEIENVFINNNKTYLEKFYKLETKYTNIKSVVKRISVEELIPYVKAIEELYSTEAGLIIVDYTQLIQNSSFKDAYNKSTLVMQMLKEAALHLRLPILCLSQVSRNAASNENGLDIHSGKDSGAIEMSSQILLALERVKELPLTGFNNKTLELYNNGEIDLLKFKILKKKRGKYEEVYLILDRKTLLLSEYSI